MLSNTEVFCVDAEYRQDLKHRCLFDKATLRLKSNTMHFLYNQLCPVGVIGAQQSGIFTAFKE